MTGHFGRMVVGVLAGSLAACGSEAPPAMVSEPSAPGIVAVPPGPTPTPTPEVVPAVELADQSFTVFSLPEGWAEALDPRDDVAVVPAGSDPGADHLVRVPSYLLPDAEARAEVDRRIAGRTEGSPNSRDTIDTRCASTLASPRLVSMTCSTTGSGGRTGFDRHDFALSYAIDGSAVRDVDVYDALAPGPPLAELARDACRETAEEEDIAPRVCGDLVVSFGPAGFAVLASADGESVSTVIPYDAPALAGRLLSDGPLGSVLPRGAERTVVVSAETALEAELAAHPFVRWAVGPARPLEVAVLEMPASGLGVAVVDGGFSSVRGGPARSLAEVATLEEEARSAAGTAAITRLPRNAPALEVTWLGTTEELALRDGPGTGHTLLRNLPLGTSLFAVEGEIEGQLSERGGRGSWVRVVVAEGIGGWVAGRYLSDADCVRVRLEGSTLPTAARDRASSAIVGVVGAHHYVVLDGVDRSWVLEMSDCSYGRVERTIEVPGQIDTVRWISSRYGPDVLVVTSSPRAAGEPGFDGTTRWSLVPPGATTPVWSTEARGHPSVPDDERATLALGVRAGTTTWDVEVRVPGASPRRARWTGSELVEGTER